MDLRLTLEPHDVLVVHARDGSAETTLSVQPAKAGIASLTRALDQSIATGYGECFWPATYGGLYWWVFKREESSVEVAAMWTRGGAALWEHVFRATDTASWVRTRLTTEIGRLGLPEDDSRE